MLEKIFKLSAQKTTVRTEILAGITTFMTMSYILAVNPSILSETGMDKNALFTATALSAIAGTLVMSFIANYPFALAPGMGLNAFFTYTVVIGMGYTWQFALTAVFLEGIIFLILTAFNIRELIVNSIPLNVKHSISAGIGLFIAFIGLQKAGIIVNNEATLVSLGNMGSNSVLVAVFGLIVCGVLLAKNVRGALLIGIFSSTVIALLLGVTSLPTTSVVSIPPSIEPIFWKFDFSHIFSLDMLFILFTFLFVDMFDTVGTLIGVADKADMLNEKHELPRVKHALFADAVGTTLGAVFGTSTVSTYVESASGVAAGGRTGLTSFTVVIMFAISLFFAPLFIMIPASATAPVLVLVGLFMMSPIKKIDFNDFTEAIPAFLTIVIMPLTYSIAEGIIFGMLSYVILKLLTGKHKQLSLIMYVIAVLFILKFFM